MTTRPLRVGIVGGGFMASAHSDAARSARARLAGIASSSAAKAEEAAERLGVETAFGSVAELVSDPSIDLVHVCTPNSTHAEISSAVIAAGKHVVCEKPLATSSDDARRLAAEARAAGVVATVPFVYRFHPMVREARARVAAGEIGRLLTLSGSYLQDWLLDESDDNWRVDASVGGPSRAFADIGSHLVDLLEFVTGDRIARLSSSTSTVFAQRAPGVDVTTEDAAALVVETRAGAIGTLLVSQVAPGRKNRLAIEIAGSRESIGFDQEQPESLWIGRRAGSGLVLREAETMHEEAARYSTLPAGHPLGYNDAFTAFVADTYRAVRGEAPDGLPTFDDGLRAALVTEAMLESAATSRWIDVEETTS